jgi:predicted RNase H-like HicB family nuclease
MKATATKDSVHVLVYLDEGAWLAHCLEFDLLGHGDSPREAVKTLLGVIETHFDHLRETGREEDIYNPAPHDFWKKLAKATYLGEIKLRSKTSRSVIPPLDLPQSEMARLNLEYRQATGL